MGSILKYIANETEGKPFASFKYCYDGQPMPHLEYDSAESSYINLKEFAEDVHDPNSRDMSTRARSSIKGAPLFKYFLDGSRKVYKVDDIQYDKKVYPIISGQISVACCERLMVDDTQFGSFRSLEDGVESYAVLSLPVSANSSGVNNDVFFNNLLSNNSSLSF